MLFFYTDRCLKSILQMKIAFLSVALLLLLVVVDVRESEQFATLCSNCADGIRKVRSAVNNYLFLI